MLHGGYNGITPGVDTTWLYDGANWTVAPVGATRPAARGAAMMAYDPVRGICVMAGGLLTVAPSTAFDDTWEFDGSSWTQVPTTFPGRGAGGMAFIPSRRQMVLFGGLSPAHGFVADTWEYGAKSRTFGIGCAGSNGVPTLAAVDAPRLGLSYSLVLTSTNSAVNSAALAISHSPIPPTPLDGIGMTGCTAYVSPDVLVIVSAAAGTASWTATIPPTSGVLGTRLLSQGISIDPNFNPAWLVTSNAHEGTVGF
ncbi:MAG: hypothetical protein ABIP94_25945 [Planctomycetota bacterium]